MIKERKSRKKDESRPDREAYEIWWQYLKQTEGFFALQQYVLTVWSDRKAAWQWYMEPYSDFVSGYEGRGWFSYTETSRSGSAYVSEDFQEIWDRWQRDKEYLGDVDGPLGEYVIGYFLREAATAPLERIQYVQLRLQRELTETEKWRVAAKEAQRLEKQLRNRVVLCIDPFSGTADEIAERVRRKVEEVRAECLVASPTAPFSHLPVGGEGCRYRTPTPGRRIFPNVLKRQLTLYVLARRYCTREFGTGKEVVSYKDLLSGRFSDGVGGPIPASLPFGFGPFTNDDNDISRAEQRLWKAWQGRKGQNERHYKKLRGEDAEAAKALEYDIRAARETLQHVSSGWFPAPPGWAGIV